jgi:glycosyltransferase involved in cell wall biosynthesis
MKITFVLGSGFSLTGGDRVIALYAQKLQERGHEVLVISRPRKTPTWRDQLRSLRQGDGWIKVRPNRPSHFDKVTVPRRMIEQFRPVVDADVPDADMVVATWWETAHWVANLSPRKGAKAYFMQDYGAPGQELEKIVPTWTLPLHIITIAQWLVDLIREHCGDIPISLVQNAADLENFYAEPRTKQPYPTIGFGYRTLHSKGTDIALEAVRLARKEVPDLKLIAFGSDKPLKAMPLPEDALFYRCPSDGEIRQLYARCDAWLFPSRLEGFGLPILEAMACRTPVIGTPAGAAPELLANGAGLLVEPENPVDMAQAIVKVCRLSQTEWRALSDAAFNRVSSYTWEDAADLFEAALYHAVQSNSPLSSQAAL